MIEWTNQFQLYLSQHNPIAYLVAYVVGILASLTPCIYPMIPVTVSFMGYIGETRKRIWPYASLYVLGMAIIYTALGIFAAFTGKVFGQFTTNSLVFIIVGIIFLFSGLSMLKVLPWDPFLSKLNNIGKKHDPKGFLGAIVLGMTSGFIAAPCTAPILGALLSYVAVTKDLLFGGTLLFVFSLGLGTLLWILSMFSGLTKFIPRGSRLGHFILTAFGVLMLGISVYFFYRGIELI